MCSHFAGTRPPGVTTGPPIVPPGVTTGPPVPPVPGTTLPPGIVSTGVPPAATTAPATAPPPAVTTLPPGRRYVNFFCLHNDQQAVY